jgi:hypothetical protein
MLRSAERPVILVITTERPSMPTTVTAVQARKTGHPDSRTNQSVQLTRWSTNRVCAGAQKPVKCITRTSGARGISVVRPVRDDAVPAVDTTEHEHQHIVITGAAG